LPLLINQSTTPIQSAVDNTLTVTPLANFLVALKGKLYSLSVSFDALTHEWYFKKISLKEHEVMYFPAYASVSMKRTARCVRETVIQKVQSVPRSKHTPSRL
jgi:hypothetical protein